MNDKIVVARAARAFTRSISAQFGDRLDWENIDWNGHKKDGRDWTSEHVYWGRFVERTEEIGSRDLIGPYQLTFENAVLLEKVWEGSGTLSEWVSIGTPMRWMSCTQCGLSDYDGYLETDGRSVRQGGERCLYPNGHLKTKVRLSFPTGRLVFADDMRELLPMERTPDINTLIGQVQFDVMNAKAGAARGFVGNSDPGIYKTKAGNYRVATYPRSKPPGSHKVGHVSTGVWAATLMSAELAVLRADAVGIKYNPETLKGLGHQGIVQMLPGTYEFVIDAEARRGPGVTQNYITWRRVGDATPVDADPYMAEWLSRDYTAHQQVAQAMDRCNGRSLVSAVDDLLFTESDWHVNGFASYMTNDPDVAPIPEIPEIEGQQKWYPYSKGYGGLMLATGLAGYGKAADTPLDEALYLSESYQELAYRVLQNIIRYGISPYKSLWRQDMANRARATNGNFVGVVHNQEELDARVDVMTRNRVRLAVTAFGKLVERWPETFGGVDPEFTTWMRNKPEVSAWIAQLQLVP